mgnify:CR=1 FL=1
MGVCRPWMANAIQEWPLPANYSVLPANNDKVPAIDARKQISTDILSPAGTAVLAEIFSTKPLLFAIYEAIYHIFKGVRTLRTSWASFESLSRYTSLSTFISLKNSWAFVLEGLHKTIFNISTLEKSWSPLAWGPLELNFGLIEGCLAQIWGCFAAVLQGSSRVSTCSFEALFCMLVLLPFQTIFGLVLNWRMVWFSALKVLV